MLKKLNKSVASQEVCEYSRKWRRGRVDEGVPLLRDLIHINITFVVKFYHIGLRSACQFNNVNRMVYTNEALKYDN